MRCKQVRMKPYGERQSDWRFCDFDKRHYDYHDRPCGDVWQLQQARQARRDMPIYKRCQRRRARAEGKQEALKQMQEVI